MQSIIVERRDNGNGERKISAFPIPDRIHERTDSADGGVRGIPAMSLMNYTV